MNTVPLETKRWFRQARDVVGAMEVARKIAGPCGTSMSPGTCASKLRQAPSAPRPRGAPIGMASGPERPAFQRPTTWFEPPATYPPTDCGEWSGEWDRCGNGATTECDSLKPDVEAGEHDDVDTGTRAVLRDAYEFINFSPYREAVFKKAVAHVIENVDVLQWLACCKSTNVAFDTKYTGFPSTYASWILGTKAKLSVHWVKNWDDVPKIRRLQRDLKELWSLRGYTGILPAGIPDDLLAYAAVASIDPTTGEEATTGVETGFVLFNGSNDTIRQLAGNVALHPLIEGNRRCMYILLGSVFAHEMVHVAMDLGHIASETTGFLTCYVHDRIANAYVWAMLQRYPHIAGSSCCASYADYGDPLYDRRVLMSLRAGARCKG